MKVKIFGFVLFMSTAALVVFYPGYQNAGAITQGPMQSRPIDSIANVRPQVEVVFVLDTTGSMGGLIQAAKDKVWSIATTMATAQPAPDIKMGLVAYRDRGDAYVTKVVDLSKNLDSMYAELMDFQAAGGGDGPESVNRALHDAIHKMTWSQNPQAYKVVFLVGDAPPHMDNQDAVKYPNTIAAALEKGIVINTIQCGQNGATTREWQQIAQLGHGRYFQVDQAGSAVAIATPFDERLAELSARLDDTRIYYGSAAEKEERQRKLDAAEKLRATSSLESRARRAAFNVSKSGKANLIGAGELVDDVDSGRVDLDTIDAFKLPEPMQAMAPEEQQTLIRETAERRKQLQREIEELAQQRSTFLKKKVKEQGGAEDSLDHKIYNAVREQAGKLGLSYENDGPHY